MIVWTKVCPINDVSNQSNTQNDALTVPLCFAVLFSNFVPPHRKSPQLSAVAARMEEHLDKSKRESSADPLSASMFSPNDIDLDVYDSDDSLDGESLGNCTGSG